MDINEVNELRLKYIQRQKKIERMADKQVELFEWVLGDAVETAASLRSDLRSAQAERGVSDQKSSEALYRLKQCLIALAPLVKVGTDGTINAAVHDDADVTITLKARQIREAVKASK